MDSEVLFKLINEFIVAIASLLWPIVTLIIVFAFKNDLTDLLKRFRKGKIFGQEMELDPNIIEFNKVVKEAQEEIPESEKSPEQHEKDELETDHVINDIIEIAKANPELGLIKLSSVLEREIRLLVSSLGAIPRNRVSAIQLFEILIKKGYLPPNTTKSIKIFWNLRNEIVHGYIGNDERNIIQVIDSGIVLLKTIKSIPHEFSIVYKSNIQVYSDNQCTMPIEGIKGVLIDNISPGGVGKRRSIFATSNPEYYSKTERVSWEWHHTNILPAAWYKDPDSNEIKKAWDSTAEFSGRYLKDL